MRPSKGTGLMPSEPPHLELFPELDRTWPAHGLGPVAVIVAQLPDPANLPTGALVVVRESARPPRGFRRLARGIRSLWRKAPKAHPAVRCTALLARGYREIAARIDARTGEYLVWGLAPTSPRSSSGP
jgi:hypothetical protein